MNSSQLQVDAVTDRPEHRLTSLYSLKLDERSRAALDASGRDLPGVAEYLQFGRLAVHYQGAMGQFPTVLVSQQHAQTPCDGPRNSGAVEIRNSRSWLFRVPHGGFVAGLTVDFFGPLNNSIPLLEDAYYGEVKIGPRSFLEALRSSAEEEIASYLETAQLATHGHQLLFVPGSCEDLVTSDGESARRINHDLVRRLIYRYDAPYRHDSGLVGFPSEANRGMRALAACGPYFSVLASQQDYVENCALVAAIQLVGCADLLNITRAEAFDALTDLRSLQTAVDQANGIEHRQVRRRLARLSERVGRLELDLSFGVEAYQEIAALVPSLRVSGLHRQLFDSAAISDQSRSIDQMLQRLERAVAAESASVIASERSRDERRRLAWGVAIGFASFVAIPLTLIFGFFALATTDVSRNSSLLDVGRYKWFYATVAGVMAVTLCLSLAAWLSKRDRD